MAKIVGPLHSDRAKGSFSGVTFREYRGMPTLTRRARPVRRWTAPLLNNRSIFSFLSRYWGTVTAVNRLLWTEYAAIHPIPNGMGGTFQLDGNQMFMSMNHTAIRLGGMVKYTDTPPIRELPGVVDTVAAVAGLASGGITITWTLAGTPHADDYDEVAIAGPFNSAGRLSVNSRFKHYAAVLSNVLTMEVTGLLPGSWYWVRVRHVGDEGIVSNWVWDQSLTKV